MDKTLGSFYALFRRKLFQEDQKGSFLLHAVQGIPFVRRALLVAASREPCGIADPYKCAISFRDAPGFVRCHHTCVGKASSREEVLYVSGNPYPMGWTGCCGCCGAAYGPRCTNFFVRCLLQGCSPSCSHSG